MNLSARFDHLIQIAESLDIEVRYEAMGGEGGGLCTFRGRRVLFVDTLADAATRYDRLLADLAPLPELDDAYLLPEVRDDIDKQRRIEDQS